MTDPNTAQVSADPEFVCLGCGSQSEIEREAGHYEIQALCGLRHDGLTERREAAAAVNGEGDERMTDSERYPHVDPDHQARDEGEARRAERRESHLDNLWEAYAATWAEEHPPVEPKPPATANRLQMELFEESA